MTAVRKQYAAEWSARREREAAAMASIVEEGSRRAALRRARKDEHKALRQAMHRQALAQRSALKGCVSSIPTATQAKRTPRTRHSAG